MPSEGKQPMSEEVPLMTTKEVAAILRCTPETIRLRCMEGAEGDFPHAAKIGKNWLIPKSDVDAILLKLFGPE